MIIRGIWSYIPYWRLDPAVAQWSWGLFTDSKISSRFSRANSRSRAAFRQLVNIWSRSDKNCRKINVPDTRTICIWYPSRGSQEGVYGSRFECHRRYIRYTTRVSWDMAYIRWEKLISLSWYICHIPLPPRGKSNSIVPLNRYIYNGVARSNKEKSQLK